PLLLGQAEGGDHVVHVVGLDDDVRVLGRVTDIPHGGPARVLVAGLASPEGPAARRVRAHDPGDSARSGRACQDCAARGANRPAMKVAIARALGTRVATSMSSSLVWNPDPRGPIPSMDGIPIAAVVLASEPPPTSGDSSSP